MEKHSPLYNVQSDGRVFSLKSNWRGYGTREMGYIDNGRGYFMVRLTVNGKRKAFLVHQLVAKKFLGKRPKNHPHIRHLDGNSYNNDYKNLAYGTAKDNALDRDKHGRTSRGIKHSRAIRKGLGVL